MVVWCVLAFVYNGQQITIYFYLFIFYLFISENQVKKTNEIISNTICQNKYTIKIINSQ